MVNNCLSILIHFYRTYRTSTNTRTFYFTNGVKRTYLFTTTTFNTKLLIDIRAVVHNRNGISGTYFLALMTQTAAACRIQNVDDTIIFGRFHHQMYPFFNDMTFFVDTAAKQCLGSWNDDFRNFSGII